MNFQATGTGPAALATNDFNNDGVLDLAVANYDEGTTSILLGAGDGTFRQRSKLSNGASAKTNGIAVGDINRDGRLDLVAVNSGASSLGLFFGQGDGTFLASMDYPLGSGSMPLGVALGDLDGDGRLDLVVSDNAKNSVLVFLGNGDGTSKQNITLSTGANSAPYSIGISDFNRDGRLDIAVSNAGKGTVGIFLGDGTGKFAEQKTYATGASPNTFAIADFNRDGITDIATANYQDNTTSVLIGNGDGSFRQQTTFSTGSGSLPYSIRTGDFNRDNVQDIIVANSGTNNVGVLLGFGNGRFRTVKTYPTGDGSSPNDVVVGDFNRDSRLDFVSAGYRSNGIGTFLSTCS